MATAYNLRSSQKKKYDFDSFPSSYRCYLKDHLGNRSPETFNPKVCLERLKLSDYNNIQNCRFYMDRDKIKIVKDEPIVSNKRCFYKLLSIILLASCMIYFNDKVQLYAISLAKTFTQFYPAIQNFYFQAAKAQRNYLKSLINKIQNISSDNAALEDIQDFILKSTNDDFEISKLVRDNILEQKKRNSFQNSINTEESFIEKQCKLVIKDKLETFFDESNITDYALESLGAKIVTTFNTEPYGIKTVKFLNFNIWPFLGSFLIKNSKYSSINGPNSILVPWKKPGDCWAFKGSRGRVQIKLSEKIFVTAITIDHIPKKNIFDGNIKSAPKKFSLIGIEEPGVLKGGKCLGIYEYKNSGVASQTFSVQNKVKIPFNWVEISIESNHGNEYYTCVYKVRIHGHK